MRDNRGGRDGKWCFGAIQSTCLVGVFLFKVKKKKKEARNLISAVSAPSFESFDFLGGDFYNHNFRRPSFLPGLSTGDRAG